MRPAIFAVIACIACPSASAAVPDEPYGSYVRNLVEEEIPTAGDVWEGAGAGGFLFRFRLDIDQDGQEELFLTSSLETFHLSSTWHAFKAASDGQYQAYSDTLYFCLRGCILGRVPGKLTLFSWEQPMLSEPITGFRHDFQDGLLRATRGILSEEDRDALHAAVAEGRLEVFSPRLEAVSLYDLLHDPDAPWVALDSDRFNLRDYVRHPDLNLPPESFTAHAAATLLGLSPLIPERPHFISVSAGASDRPLVARPASGKSAAPFSVQSASVSPFPRWPLIGSALMLTVWWIGRRSRG